MGVYDFLKGQCPICGTEIGENSGDIQIKWFSDYENCFRVFKPGDILPEAIEDGDYVAGSAGVGYCKCDNEMPLLARVRNNKFIGFDLNPKGPIYNINHTTRLIRNLIDDYISDFDIDKSTTAKNNKFYVTVLSNILLFGIYVYLIVIVLFTLGFIFNKFEFFKSNAGNFVIGSIASMAVTVIAFVFAIWRGDQITEYFSEKRRLHEWIIVGKLASLKLSKMIDKLFYDIYFVTGLPYDDMSLNYIISAVNNYNDSDYNQRQFGAISRIISALPDLLMRITSFSDAISSISKDYNSSLPTTTYKQIVSTMYEMTDLMDIVNEYGGIVQKEAWSNVLTVTDSGNTNDVFSYYELYQEKRIIKRLFRVFKELEQLKVNVTNMSVN